MTLPARPLRVALAQMQSGPDRAANLTAMRAAAEEGAHAGAQLVLFPENAAEFAPGPLRLEGAEALDGPLIEGLRSMALELGVALLIGSFAERASAARAWNTLVLIDACGEITATYRKMHLFDVDLGEDNVFRESAHTPAGSATPVLAEIGGWKLGLSICYDLRFPELYRALAARGAHALVVPAAFTLPTGVAHWEVLLRARAIENLCWVLAPAQVGICYGRRRSYGHSLAVDPWGEVVALRPEGVGIEVLDLLPERLAEVRSRLPALEHRRLRVEGDRA